MKADLFLREVCELSRRYLHLCRAAAAGEIALVSERLNVRTPILRRLRALSDEQAEELAATPYFLLQSAITLEDIRLLRDRPPAVDYATSAKAKHVARAIRALNMRYVALCNRVSDDQVAEAVLRLNIDYSVVQALRECSMDQLEHLVMRAHALVELSIEERALDHALDHEDGAKRFTYLAAAGASSFERAPVLDGCAQGA